MAVNLFEERKYGFFVRWTIKNFSFFVEKNSESIDSPKFVVNAIDDKWFKLQLYPRKIQVPGYISYFLRRESNVSACNYALSIRDCDGIYKEIHGTQFNLSSSLSKGFPRFMNHIKLNEPGVYLNNDTLYLGCRIWRNYEDIAASLKCYAYTEIKVMKIHHLWTVDDLEIKWNSNLTTEIPTCSTEIPFFKIQLCNSLPSEDAIHFNIKQQHVGINFSLVCTIHLLDKDKKIAHTIQGQYKSNGIQIWEHPFLSKQKLFSNKELYLPNGRLTLRCECSASTGDIHHAIERFESGITDDFQLKSSIPEQLPDLSDPWAENLQRFYKDGKFSDVTVQSTKRQYPVHKAMLCAQSEVFCAMFESDMKESRTGVVEIKDLEDDTISKMLMFLYTNTIEDLDFPMACHLYLAADKYQITALYRKCVNYLIDGLDTSNVCVVLALADTGNDQHLKSISQEFIHVHSQEILFSDDWKKLMETRSYLTSETMLLILCKKFKS